METTESQIWKCTEDIRTRVRLARLQSVEMEIPDDAKTPEQMLKEIKDKIEKR